MKEFREKLAAGLKYRRESGGVLGRKVVINTDSGVPVNGYWFKTQQERSEEKGYCTSFTEEQETAWKEYCTEMDGIEKRGTNI